LAEISKKGYKYNQLIEKLKDAIGKGTLQQGDRLPSYNELSIEYGMAKETIKKAITQLKRLGIVESIPKKGLYVTSQPLQTAYNVFVLFDSFSPYKEILYNTFRNALPSNASIDIYFHHYDVKTFQLLVDNAIGRYTHYVIIPLIDDKVKAALDVIPPDQLYLLDQKTVSGMYNGVVQNFEKDIFQALVRLKSYIKRYRELILVVNYPSSQLPDDLILGFDAFCNSHQINGKKVRHLSDIRKIGNKAFIVFDDADLAQLIETCTLNESLPGVKTGIISYNDTPLKRILAGGITTISTDFTAMGNKMAQIILQKESGLFENEFHVIVRNSL